MKRYIKSSADTAIVLDNDNKFRWNKYLTQENIICFLYGNREKMCKKYLFEISENKITNISCLD